MSLIISVSGVRGLVGRSLTPEVALEFAQSFGTVLSGGRVALGRDTRPSGEMFARAACAGLLVAGCEVTDLGVVMTPTIGRAIVEGGYDGGLMVTASHNPGVYNGLKFLDQRGLAPDPETVERIRTVREERTWVCQSERFVPVRFDDAAGERHVDAVLEHVEVEPDPTQRPRVVLDSVNGAGCLHTPALLAGLGCELVHLNGEPTGRFAHEPEPIRENLTQLCEAVRQYGAVAGFAQDPDADRLAIVDEQGTYIGEEYTLALAAWSRLLQQRGPLAANLSTSRLIDAVAERFGVVVHRTPVGEAHVARAVLEHGCVLGGEGNGGVIDPRISLVRDSLSAISLVLQLMTREQKTISQLVAELPRYAMIKRKLELPRERVGAILERVADAFAGERLNRTDGVRVDFAEGWVHVRPSNTEPVVRIIAEAADEPAAEALIERVRGAGGF